ncbi:MAG: preprotein translocase subunit YajC [Acidimicrobiia bacterium]|nr:preprotein translocase subunit YajC [Acidimicrobiia bacterium]
MYFLMVRPQKKRADEQRRLIASLEPGDEVVTIGGVFGDIVEIQDAEVILEVYDGTQVRFLRSAIARKVVPEDAADEIDEVDDDYEDGLDDADIDVSDEDAIAAEAGASPESNGDSSSSSKAKAKSKADDNDD